MSEFKREDRYIVIKRSDMEKAQAKVRFGFETHCRRIHDAMLSRGAPARSFLVIEGDWPEYEPVWRMIERRMNGEPCELAALREELALSKAETDGCRAANMVLREELKTERLRADTSTGDANEAERRLAAAEQRSSELVELLREVSESLWQEDDSCDLFERIDAALAQPTESGASE